MIKDKTSNKSVSYWDFATTDDFQKLEIPDTIKESELSELSHKNTQAIEIKSIHNIVTGRYNYVHDMCFPNMLHARIVRPPNYHSKFEKVNKNFSVNFIPTTNFEDERKKWFYSLDKQRVIFYEYLSIAYNLIKTNVSK